MVQHWPSPEPRTRTSTPTPAPVGVFGVLGSSCKTEAMTRTQVHTVIAQWAMGGALVLGWLMAHALSQPTELSIGTLHDAPLATPADASLTALAGKGHDCGPRADFRSTGLPTHLVMTKGRTAVLVPVDQGWTLAQQGWTVAAWCAK